MATHFIELTIEMFNTITFEIICTKPDKGRKAILAPRCFQLFLNHRPALGTMRLRNIIGDLYKDFRVADSAIPYFLLHIKAHPDTYDLKLSADLRKFFFKPNIENKIYEKLRSYLWSHFNKISAQFDTNDETERLADFKKDERIVPSCGFQLNEEL
jgi:hypothetical protein